MASKQKADEKNLAGERWVGVFKKVQKAEFLLCARGEKVIMG